MDDDRGEIENLMARYCELYDDGDFDGYARLFEHGHVVGPWSTLTGPDEIRTFHEGNAILYDGLPLTRHVTTNVQIRVDASGLAASGRCYVTIYQATPDFPLQVVYVGRYVDAFAKIDGAWWFTERKAEPLLVGDLSRHGRVALRPGIPDGSDVDELAAATRALGGRRPTDD
jgi:3-phenylpropionate/cinnamic acid dioxygenase small subunit